MTQDGCRWQAEPVQQESTLDHECQTYNLFHHCMQQQKYINARTKKCSHCTNTCPCLFFSPNDNLKSKVSFPARPPTANLRHGRRLERLACWRPDMEKHRHANITCTWPRSLLLPQCPSQAPDAAFPFLSIFFRNCLSRSNPRGDKVSACCAATNNMPVQRWPAALCRLGSGSGQAHKRPAPTGTLGWRFRC